MKITKPPKLGEGSTLGIVSPSMTIGGLRDDYERGLRCLRELGFRVKEGETTRASGGDMPGSDQERAADINSMFADDEVDGIMCAMGGRYALRTLRHLDWGLIRGNPKVFSGMSDITTFHLAMLARAGLPCLHQSDVVFGFGESPGSPEWSYETGLFTRITTRPEPLGVCPRFSEWECWRGGEAEGVLLGGHTTTLQSLIGTSYYPRLNVKTVLFIESMSVYLNGLEKILVQMREAGLLDRVTAVLVGKVRGEENGAVVDKTDLVKESVLLVAEEYDLPVVAKMDFGHYTPNLPLPIGLKARVNADNLEVSITESYVT